MLSVENIKKKIQEAIPGADIIVEDLRNDSKHFGVDVISCSFTGKSKIEQHQMIYKALGEEMKDSIHALRIRTSTE